MEEKLHFNKLLDSLESISTSFNRYRNKPEEVIAYCGTELRDSELPIFPITVYDLLLMRIGSIQRESRCLK